ncbi:MAG: hypothetical protein A2079_06290 [Geobacteraceae bacterium GWC2_48_7]|nr:MAG: hypothetical protein A2079_06290 [Geobacteraceae bacterium GWC2_48_7]
MKKRILAAFALVLVASTSFAATARQNTGCGLGTILWENKADSSSLFQAFQATTNGTFGNQTFGISSGTLDCGQPARFVQNEQLKEFVVANMDNLAKDIAVGRGESLDTLTELLQVPAEQKSEFAAVLQSSFSQVFTHDKIAYAELMDNVAAVTAIR